MMPSLESPDNAQQGIVSTMSVQGTGEVIDETFFCSSDSPRSIKKGTKIKTSLPKLLPGEQAAAILSTAGSTIENTAQTMMTGQLIVTIVLSVSLK